MGKIKDLTGQRFSMLTVKEYVGNGSYRCVCDCGNEKIVRTGKLNAGEVKSCGCMKAKDLSGQRFGRLKVIEKDFLYQTPSGGRYWKYLCKCNCGNEVSVLSTALRSGATKSCGCYHLERVSKSKYEDLAGRKFGLWNVIERSKNHKKGMIYKCLCDCGTTREIAAYELVGGKSKSCGCNSIVAITTHGKSRERIYRTYQGMKRRCFDKNDINYSRYGARGIAVCDEWLGEHGAENFIEWAFKNGYDENLTIDRIDNNGNYEPSNCRWVTMKEQGNNRRTNAIYEINGETHTISEWSEITGIGYATLRNRFVNGWSLEEAITKPVEQKYSHKNSGRRKICT